MTIAAAKDGYLRSVAELGLAAVDFEYNQINPATFEEQLLAVRSCLSNQPWAKQEAIAWLGLGAGARYSLRLALSQPQHRPRLLVQIDTGWLDQLDAVEDALSRERFTPRPADFSVVLVDVQGARNGPFPDVAALSSRLRRLGWPVDIVPVPVLSQDQWGAGGHSRLTRRGFARPCHGQCGLLPAIAPEQTVGPPEFHQSGIAGRPRVPMNGQKPFTRPIGLR
jgi:hypothetical protein